jgi:hypothetical protein
VGRDRLGEETKTMDRRGFLTRSGTVVGLGETSGAAI